MFLTSKGYFRTMKNILILSSLIFILPSLSAQQGVHVDTIGISNITFGDTATTRSFDYFAYPYAYYTPETQFAFGAGGMLYFRSSTKEFVRPSKIKLSAYYTTNNQYSFDLTPAIYFPGAGRDLLELKVQYTKEQSKFYGVGAGSPEIENADYIMKYFRFYSEFGGLGHIINGLHTGLLYDFSTHEMADKMQNPFLLNDLPLGHDGGNLSGFGFLLILDKRDNLFYPSKNSFYKFRAQGFGRDIGSDYTYLRLVADLRNYFSFFDEHILAFQYYAELTYGDPPFFKLPALGGPNRMRGYFLGRYRDLQYMTAQVEYRKIVWWRLGVAAFYGLGDVSEKLTTFEFHKFKHSYGFGLRFVFDEKEKINLRMDIGFGENTSGIYFSMEEAF